MRSAVSGFKQTNLHDTFLMKKKPQGIDSGKQDVVL